MFEFLEAFNVLLDKLHHLNFREIPQNSLKTYLLNENQKTKSFHYHNKCEVPQGLILGPLMFLLCINDVQHVAITAKFTLFADDTCISWCGEDIYEFVAWIN